MPGGEAGGACFGIAPDLIGEFRRNRRDAIDDEVFVGRNRLRFSACSETGNEEDNGGDNEAADKIHGGRSLAGCVSVGHPARC